MQITLFNDQIKFMRSSSKGLNNFTRHKWQHLQLSQISGVAKTDFRNEGIY